MGKTFAGATMSLDGFIAGPNDTGFDLLFKWYGAGDVEVPMPDSTAQVPDSHVSEATAELMRKEKAGWGALVVGRHLYDLTNAWNGRHPLDVTTVVLTHHPPEDRPQADENFVFVTEGIEAAVAKAHEIAGDKHVAVNGGQMARQASRPVCSTRSASTSCRSCSAPARASSPTTVPRRSSSKGPTS